MTVTDKTQTRSRVGQMMSEPYELYHPRDAAGRSLRWFSLFMKHVGSRAGPGADPRESRPVLDERTGTADDAAHDERQKKRQRSDGSAALRARWQEAVAACENFGLEAASSWPKNLLADPKARIEIGGTATNYCRDRQQRTRSRATCRGLSRCGPRMTATWSITACAT